MEHQSSRRINLIADSPHERMRARDYHDEMLSETSITHVPNTILEGIHRYAIERLPVGSFLEAVITNDLRGAIAAADPYSLYALPAIVRTIANLVPNAARGSQKKYDDWIQNRS